MVVFSAATKTKGFGALCLQQTTLGRGHVESVFAFFAGGEVEEKKKELALQLGAWYQDKACRLLCKKGEDVLAQLADSVEHFVESAESKYAGQYEGHTEGRFEGHTEGHSEGHSEGYSEGHSEGYSKKHTCHRIEYSFVILYGNKGILRKRGDGIACLLGCSEFGKNALVMLESTLFEIENGCGIYLISESCRNETYQSLLYSSLVSQNVISDGNLQRRMDELLQEITEQDGAFCGGMIGIVFHDS